MKIILIYFIYWMKKTRKNQNTETQNTETRQNSKTQYNMKVLPEINEYWKTLSLTNQFYFNTKGIKLDEKSDEYFNIENVKQECSFSIEFIKNTDFSQGINVEYFTVPNVYYKQSTGIGHKFIYFELPKTKVIEIRFVKDKFLESLKKQLKTKEDEIEKLKQEFKTSNPSENTQNVLHLITQTKLQENEGYINLNSEKNILSNQIKKYETETQKVDEIQKAAHLDIYKQKISQLINNCQPLHKIFGYKKNIEILNEGFYSIQFEINKRNCTQYNECFDSNFRNNFNIRVYILKDLNIFYFDLKDFKKEYLEKSIRFYELYNKLIKSKNEIIKKENPNVNPLKIKLPDITRASFSFENITS